MSSEVKKHRKALKKKIDVINSITITLVIPGMIRWVVSKLILLDHTTSQGETNLILAVRHSYMNIWTEIILLSSTQDWTKA